MALIHCDFFSEVLQLSCSMCVVLPQGTAAERDTLAAGSRTTTRSGNGGRPSSDTRIRSDWRS